MSEFPRTPLLGIPLNKGLGGRRPTQVRRRLVLQVLELLRRGVAAEQLVSVRVATEARYNVAGSLGLRNPKLGPRPKVERCFGCFLFSVANASIVEGEVLRVT